MFSRQTAVPNDGHALLDEIQAKVAEYNDAATARQSVVREEVARLQAESSALSEVQAIASRVKG